MERLEAQMRELTGRVEDAVNGVEQLRHRLEQINSDIDLQFSQDQGQGQAPGQGPLRNSAPNAHASAGITDPNPAGHFAMRSPSPTVSSGRSRLTADPVRPGTLVPPPPDRPSGAGTLTPPGMSPGPRRSDPDALNVAATGNFRPPSAGELPAGSASAQYNAAYGLLKQADYPAAEEALKTFIAKHPRDPLAGSAQYWLGETYYALPAGGSLGCCATKAFNASSAAG